MKSSLLVVVPGDTVIVMWKSGCRVGIVKACTMKVREVQRRYGRYLHNGQYYNPLVVGFDLETGKDVEYDQSFVVKVIKRSPSRIPQAKKNHFKASAPINPLVRKGGRITGFMQDLVFVALAQLPYEFDRPLHTERFEELFAKSGLGFKGRDGYRVTVGWRLFRRWVSKNYTRIVMTAEETHKMVTDAEVEAEKADEEYWNEWYCSVGQV